jgi:predicted DNA repair protein MutK
LSAIGTAAMLWVGGGILRHGLAELHLLGAMPHRLDALIAAAAAATGPLAGAVGWLLGAVASAIVGIVVGGVIVAIVRRLTSRPEDLIVD